MSKSSDSQYLEGKILTASQPRLHLMLLEGAIRFGQQAKQKWGDEQVSVEAGQLLNRMMDVVEELTMSTTAPEIEISKQLAEQYAFLYRELGACRIQGDLQKLDECLELLEFHRQTWKLACEKAVEDSAMPRKAPVLPSHHLSPSTSDSFSLEA
jgi:flagellar protein FliS